MRNVRVLPLVLLLFAVSSLSFAQTPLGPEFQVNVQTEGDQVLPQVAMNAVGELVVHQREVAVADDGAGNFVVVWQSEEQEGSGSDVFARLYRRR